MPRIKRVVVVGTPHHITQRGNYRQKVFDSDEDRKQYLSWIEEYSKKYNVEIIAYCLMSNHIHFVVVPTEERSIGKLFNTVHMRYSQYYNKKKKQSGHLWQGRFYSCILDEDCLKEATRYVERNPVRAKMVENTIEWKWSSAKNNIGEGCGEIDVLGIKKYLKIDGKEWNEFISEKDSEEFVHNIRKATNMSRAIGKEEFIEKLEKKIGVGLKLVGRGRPWDGDIRGKEKIKVAVPFI
ncbi:MAG: transposase [Candidatus Firestonebacteria bacterium]